MSIFVVVRLGNAAAIEAAMKIHFPDESLDLGQSQWLVSAPSKTAKEVCDRLGISDGANGSGIVFAMSHSSYYGRAPAFIWEWIKTRLEAPPNA